MVTKYRYKVLSKNISMRLRQLIRQSCEGRNIKVVRESIGRDHTLISCLPSKIV